MRICYFIQNHLAPPQVARLAAALRRSQPDAFVLVGHDESAGCCSAEQLRRALGTDVFAVREPARRGYFSLLQPYFEAVEWLGRRGIPYDWLVYLSGQDFPTQPLGRFAAMLAATDRDGFLRFWDAFAPVSPWNRRRQGRCRYAFRYADAPRWAAAGLRLLRRFNGWQSLIHVHLVYGQRIGVRPRTSPFGPGLGCYAGSQWTILRRACAEYAAEEVRRDGELIRWFRSTICPDEAVVQTLLVNSGRFRLQDDHLRYEDFAGSRTGHPRLLTLGDLPALTGGRYFFARKFDLQHDGAVLDRLDEWIG
jgi:hypothetical protein